jgi:hypothetical protein
MKDYKLISNFMGYDKSFIHPDYSRHNWNWLMSVVEKIEGLDLRQWMYKWEDPQVGTQYNFEGISVEIENTKCWIYMRLALDPMFTINERTFNKTYGSKIEATYDAVVEFIKWYNERMVNHISSIQLNKGN